MDAKLLYFWKDTSDKNISRIKDYLDQAAGENEDGATKQMEASVPQMAANWVELIKHGQGNQFSQWAAEVMNKAERAEFLTDHGRKHEEVMGQEVFYRTVEEMQKLMPRQEFAKYLPHRDIQQSAQEIEYSVANNRSNKFWQLNGRGGGNAYIENEHVITDAEINGTTWVPAVPFKGYTLEATAARVATLQDEKAKFEKCLSFDSYDSFSNTIAPNRSEKRLLECSNDLHSQLDRKRS